ncbi:DNA mismatch repair protein [Didymosphaeria variabile]|uniref:DNA mismatch repair protein n=1 Tax=Didymosphaeria variabile TaxID=1932322 RepID=A0A9W9CEE8_9PLEO|nr:DNA mismatch repair protein [Didymosphaeria variabile]KAJ4357922.1 DNA mismatch repair protein [Didymosphaeria variabile]
MSARQTVILPLPQEVVAQIKSSTAIVSLTDVVLGLLGNALDAKASKVEATVDFARGGCFVEDNGLGIAPSEFREEGGLGKLYCTSRYFSEDECLGRNGTFLASLGAMSLLTIASRHHEHRSHNSLSLHHSTIIDRQLPASSVHELHGKHGTRVTVRNLFGNLPVRVKQRGLAAEQRTEYDRLWEILKREITGLMLSWHKPVSLRVRDAGGKTSLSLSTAGQNKHGTRRRPSRLHSVLNVLTQASYIHHDEWPSWVPVSASTSTICIEGAISRDPAPSKRVQFISLGVTPLSADTGRNELYDEVNRLFALSSFGIVENGLAVDEDEKIQRQDDNRFKHDGYANKQVKARKGVDRYPMFHLRMSFPHQNHSNRTDTLFSEDQANLSIVMEVLKAMITEWLAVHHFQPRKASSKHAHRSSSGTSSKHAEHDETALSGHQTRPVGPISRTCTVSTPPMSKLAETDSRKRKRSQAPFNKKGAERDHHLAFRDWSRIKSGNATHLGNLGIKRDVWTSQQVTNHPSSNVQDSTAPYFAKFNVIPVPAGFSDGVTRPDISATEVRCVDEGKYDEAVPWTDPITKQTYFLNTRTGCVLPRPLARPQTDLSPHVRGSTLSDFNKSLRLCPTSTTPSIESNTWLNGFLRTWDNPVFKPAETKIQQALLHKDGNGHDCNHSNHSNHFGRRSHNDETIHALSTSNASKLSRAGLENAEVMAQLDRKFILVKMGSCEGNTEVLGANGHILVLIDQHAADERTRVESLLTEMCAPLSKGIQNYRTKLGHESHIACSILGKPIHFALSALEQGQFKRHAAKFATWGILYDVGTSTTSSMKSQSTLSVTALPPVISERCKADPQVLIAFLRTTVWKYADAVRLPLPADEWERRGGPSNDRAAWVRRIASCPEGLIDLVNSRACRSAIMFNDELSMEECRELVRKLCKCVFPFMCAHGRPSMVPLVDIASALGSDSATDTEGAGDFITIWKRRQMK